MDGAIGIAGHRDLARQALFDTTFTVEMREPQHQTPPQTPSQTQPHARAIADELHIQPVALELPRAKFDLSATVAIAPAAAGDAPAEMALQFEYSSDLFDAATIARYAGYYLNLLDDALNHPERKLSALRLIPPDERRQLLAWAGAPATPHIHTIPASEAGAWVKVGDRLAEEWVKEVSAKGYPGQEMLDSARALIAKHSK